MFKNSHNSGKGNAMPEPKVVRSSFSFRRGFVRRTAGLSFRQRLVFAFLVALTFLFAVDRCVYAQSAAGLQVGDRVPDKVFTGAYGLPSGAASLRLTDFGGKLLVLDFWATWCSPCIGAMPEMDSLQRVFEGKMQFLQVAYQPRGVVNAFLAGFRKSYRFSLPGIAGDAALVKLFPHMTLPHYVWIGGDGRVLAVTGHEAVTAGNIVRVLAGDVSGLKLKKDEERIAYAKGKPLFVGGNGGNGSAMLYRSMGAGYLTGIPPGYHAVLYDTLKPADVRISMMNMSPLWFFKMAFGEGRRFFSGNGVLLSVRDTALLESGASGEAYTDWCRMYGRSYELNLPPELGERAFSIMREDMLRMFPQYRAGVEKRKRSVYALVRTDVSRSVASAGGKPSWGYDGRTYRLKNGKLADFLVDLDLMYMSGSPKPVVDLTGITGPVDMELNCKMGSVPDMNRELARYGLMLREQVAEVNMLVIRDRVMANR